MTVSFLGKASLAAMGSLKADAAALASQADEMGVALAEAAKPLAAPIKRAGLLSDEVFDSLRPHSGQFAHFEPQDLGRIVPQATRDAGVAKLDEAITLMDQGAQGIDDALGAGTWMSQSVRETRAFHVEARRVMADPTLGPDSADHAIDLLRRNGFTSGDATRALERGDLRAMTSTTMGRQVEVASPEAFADAAGWRTVFGPPPVA